MKGRQQALACRSVDVTRLCAGLSFSLSASGVLDRSSPSSAQPATPQPNASGFLGASLSTVTHPLPLLEAFIMQSGYHAALWSSAVGITP